MMRKIFTTITCILLTIILFSQNTKKAEKAFAEGNYEKAIEEYDLLLEQTDDSQLKARYKFYIGESYCKLNRPDKAEKPLLDAIKGGFISDNVYYMLGKVQLRLGKYDDALLSFESYKRANPSDPLGDVGIASCKFSKDNTQENSFFNIISLVRLNSRRNEFGVSYFNDGLLFSSTRSVVTEDDKKDDSSNEVYTRSGFGQSKVYLSSGNNGVFNRPIEISELNKLKDFPDDGIFSYDPYSRQGFYARRDGKNACIQFMELKANKWVKKDKLDIKSKKEPIGHPFITPDGNRIYFTSTMPGGYGKSDIWYIERSGKGWSDPINAGDKINTAGNEVYPFIAGDYLFFSSDGHVGYGGFDIYASKLDNGAPQEAFNLGHPFNTHFDDYNIVMRSDLEEGVFISGRNEKWGDDIFYFKGLPFSILASGVVTDATTGNPIANVTVELFKESDNSLVNKTTTNNEGRFLLYVAPDQKYSIKTNVAGYAINNKFFKTGNNRFGILDAKRGLNLDFKLVANASVISGRVYERRTFVAIEDQNVDLLINGKVVQTVKTNADGNYRFGDIKENTNYIIRIAPNNYFADSKNINIGKVNANTEFNKSAGYDTDFALEKCELNKEILIDKVDFPKERADLLPDSYKELDRLAHLFIKNHQYNILITAYTDSKANVKTANELTLNRAEAVKDYLVIQGVNATRLTAEGKGKNKLLIPKARTEAEHKRNNRVTYILTGVTKTTQSSNSSTVVSSAPTASSTVVQPQVKDPKSINIGTKESNYADLPFRIQISALKVLNLNDPLFLRIKSELNMDVHYALGVDGWYRYYIGGFKTKEEAQSVLRRLKTIKADCMIKAKSAF